MLRKRAACDSPGMVKQGGRSSPLFSHSPMKPHLLLAILSSLTISMPTAFSQAPGVTIEKHGRAVQDAIIAKAEKLRKDGKLKLNIETVKKQLASPAPGPLVLPTPNTHPLSGREIAKRAREGYLQFGWFYLCTRCDHWHINLAGAYAIAEDAAATCHHCVESKSDMKEGYLIAVDSGGEVIPVTAILAKSSTMDAAIVRVDGKLKPLALNDNVAPGDPAYLYSEPLGQSGYFSNGIVNRFYWKGRAGKPGAADEWKTLRVNVSTDWAPGSSGAGVVDQCGNVIGHVSTISPLSEKPKPKSGDAAKNADRFGGATLITLHEAVPARGVLSLAKELRELKPGEVIAKTEPEEIDDEEVVASAMRKAGVELRVAMANKEWDKAEKLLEEFHSALPESKKSVADEMRFLISVEKRTGDSASKAAAKLLTAADADAEKLNNFAWMLVATDGMEGVDFSVAEKLARKAVDSAPAEKRAHIQDTLARALFRAGKKEEAIKEQEQAVAGAGDDLKEELAKTLEAYRKGELPAAH